MRPSLFRCSTSLLGLATLAATQAANADPLSVLNTVRTKDCASKDAIASRLAALDTAAQAVADGKNLRDALDGSGYRAVNAVLLTFQGAHEEKELARLIAQSCSRIAPPSLHDVGIFQREKTLWILLAQPFGVPTLDKAATGASMLNLVNRARAEARRCGSKDFVAAPPLKWSPELEKAATDHARDMAEAGSLSHQGPDGSSPSKRATDAGYTWFAVGENIAGGQRDAETAVKTWLDSESHCANIMNPAYADMAVAFATNAKSELGIYWSLMLATHEPPPPPPPPPADAAPPPPAPAAAPTPPPPPPAVPRMPKY